jgi:hypothetical protein
MNYQGYFHGVGARPVACLVRFKTVKVSAAAKSSNRGSFRITAVVKTTLPASSICPVELERESCSAAYHFIEYLKQRCDLFLLIKSPRCLGSSLAQTTLRGRVGQTSTDSFGQAAG